MTFFADQSIVTQICRDIEDRLLRIGIVFRIFGRVKTSQSLKYKLEQRSDKYITENKKLQDLFGIRIALYFSDDVDIAQEVVRSLYRFHSRSIDKPTNDSFGPTRCNIIYHLPEDLATNSHLVSTVDLIDSTFEVQYRTILSEGWHEVEHDLRYKCKADWNDHNDLSRSLNGIMATLETCDWSMIKMFDELAWRHYKAGIWGPMIRTKFRLRFQKVELTQEISELLTASDGLAKAIFRVDRTEFLKNIASQNILLPITPSNIIFIINRLYIKDTNLKNLENEALSALLDERIEL